MVVTTHAAEHTCEFTVASESGELLGSGKIHLPFEFGTDGSGTAEWQFTPTKAISTNKYWSKAKGRLANGKGQARAECKDSWFTLNFNPGWNDNNVTVSWAFKQRALGDMYFADFSGGHPCASFQISQPVQPTQPTAASPTLRVGWVYDRGSHVAANRAGRNCWGVYLREILDELGLAAEEIAPAALKSTEKLSRYSTVLLEGAMAGRLAKPQQDALTKWVKGGGTLIASAADGLDELAGNRPSGRLPQPEGEFSCTATFAFRPHPLTRDLHSHLQPDQCLLVFSEVRLVRPERSIELARLYERAHSTSSGQVGRDTGCAAVTERQVGQGRVFSIAFSVAQTMWVLHQGRPVNRDYDGDKYLRRSDSIVIRPHSIEVGYADELLFLLQNMISAQPHPFVHQLPPTAEGGIPDALFHWGGDDEGDRTGIALRASNWMKERGLPYHINAMPWPGGKFGLTAEDARRIRDNGHEVSIHFNFIDDFQPGSGFARQDVLDQAAAFKREFGQDFVCSVNHWCRWTGWSEPARWMLEAGGKADNSFTHAGSPPYNPVNLLGFSFGTAFPFWFYDDWRGGNRRIEFIEQPVTAYECGYVGKERTDFPTVHKVIDQAARHHLTMNMFYHPIYIDQFPHCRAAIEEALRYLKERKIRALHLGSDALSRWWTARSETQVTRVALAGHTLSFLVETRYPDGAIIKVPLSQKTVQSVRVNGAPARSVTEQRFGQRWLLMVVPSGRSRVECALALSDAPAASPGSSTLDLNKN
jgi:hypothetical protein